MLGHIGTIVVSKTHENHKKNTFKKDVRTFHQKTSNSPTGLSPREFVVVGVWYVEDGKRALCSVGSTRDVDPYERGTDLCLASVRLTAEVDLHECGPDLCLVFGSSTVDIDLTEFISDCRGSVGADCSLHSAALRAATASRARSSKDNAGCEYAALTIGGTHDVGGSPIKGGTMHDVGGSPIMVGALLVIGGGPIQSPSGTGDICIHGSVCRAGAA